MSATDSDNSIDWLASDNEEDSEQEAECSKKQHLALSDSQHQHSREKESEWSEASSRDSQAWPVELCNTQQGQEMHGKRTPQALKRSPSSKDEEHRERQLISNVSEKEQSFSRKCIELQCYIHPLSLILNGLRSGRYRERLSSFQESVAMDRIQRIMGVLQNPCMGEKYINIILKMEEMLKSWFPNVKLPEQPLAAQTEEPGPTKKLKLSTSMTVGPFTSSEPAVGPKALRVTDLTPPGAYSACNMKWLHTSPICSSTAEQNQAGPRPQQSPQNRDLTQDSAVSSSTDSPAQTEPVPRGPPLGKINAPCLERLLKSTESIISRRASGALMDSSSS